MTDDSTLGGYVAVHDRAPAFEGSDGRAYSAAVYVDDSPGADGRFGAALLFIQWSAQGDRPEGHLESDYLAFGDTAAEAEVAVRRLTLLDVKRELERAIIRSAERPAW